MGNLTAVISADVSGFQRSITEAQRILEQYKNSARNASDAISNASGVSQQQVAAFQRVVKQLEKVNSGTQTTAQQQKNLAKQIQELRIQWANLSNEAKNSDFGKAVSNSISSAEQHLEQLNTQLQQTRVNLNNAGGSASGLGAMRNQISSISGAMGDLGLQGGNVLSSLSSMGGALANPYVAAGAAVTGAAYALIDYNNTLSEQTRKVEEFTGVQGESAVAIRNGVKSICDVYDSDFNETIQAANSLAKHMGISYQDALNQISLGFSAGANAGGDFLDQLNEYSTYLKEAGMNTQQMIGLMVQSQQQGVFSDKALDTIKEANLRLREMPSSTQAALEAIGMSSQEVQASLRDGTKTTFDVIQEVSAKLNELPPQSSEVGQAIADIFGGPGEDAGLAYIQTLKDIGDSTDDVRSKMSDQQRATYDLQQADQELENALASMFGVSEAGWGTMVNQIKTKVYTAIASLINYCIDLYNKSTLIRSGIASIALNFKQAWAVIKAVCKQFAISLEAISDVIEDIINLNFSKVGDDVKKAVAASEANLDGLGKEFMTNIGDAIKSTLHGNIAKIKLTPEIDQSTLNRQLSGSGGGSGGGSSSGRGITGNGKIDKDTKKTIDNTEKYAEGSLDDLQHKLDEFKNKYKAGLLPKETPSSYKSTITEMQQAINRKKFELGIDETKLAKEIQDTFEAKKAKLKTEIDTKLEVNDKRDQKSPGRDNLGFTSFKETNSEFVDLNNEIEKSRKKVSDIYDEFAKLDTKGKRLSDQANNNYTVKDPKSIPNTRDKYSDPDIFFKQSEDQKLNNKTFQGALENFKSVIDQQLQVYGKAYEELDALNEGMAALNARKEELFEAYGSNTAEWTEPMLSELGDIDQQILLITDDIDKFTKELDTMAEYIDKNIDGFNRTQDNMDKVKKHMKTWDTVNESVSQTATLFSNVGSAVGGTAGDILSLTGTVLQSVAQMIPQIMSLFAAQEAQAIGGATASGASLPFPANIIAIAAGVASVIAAFAQVGSFAEGGIIDGKTSIGDYNIARVNSGELIMNGTQQKRLWNILNGQSGVIANGAPSGKVEFVIKGSKLNGVLKNYNSKKSKV